MDCRKIYQRHKGKPSIAMIITFATGKLSEKVTVGYNVCNMVNQSYVVRADRKSMTWILVQMDPTA